MDFETYERERWADYADFAAVVASILIAAIHADPRLRLQQVKDRAKAPSSLKKKLKDREITETTTLEADIKDLAGCRAIFYTNSDVNTFITSRIMQTNFKILETKLHYPRQEVADVNELYVSNHYLVKLRPERLALPEYARFSDMHCEVQVQTILNHAWAEMAHDTIYKTPRLDGFGADALDAVRRRLDKVAHKYLIPAGYEFQKITNDFQRLLQGKRLFDEGALDAIVASENNNTRAEALETFTENVLPYYDDVQGEYPRIVGQLLEAVEIARSTSTIPIETPFGSSPGKTSTAVLHGVLRVLETYRYADIDVTFDALCKLFLGSDSESDRKPLYKAAERLAKHELEVWQSHGPAAQLMLVGRISGLPPDARRVLWPLLATMLGEVLKTEVTGTTASSSTVTMHRGAVVPSKALREVRAKAIDLLKTFLSIAESDEDRRVILDSLQVATRMPRGVSESDELERLLLENTRELLSHQKEIAPTLSYEILQTLEERALRIYRSYHMSPESAAPDSAVGKVRKEVLAAALAFREKVNADRKFVIYKTLVGFNSVFSPAWGRSPFDHRDAEVYREAQVERLIGEVNEATSEEWFEIISRCAQTKSSDAATFPVFGRFLSHLAENKPDIVIGYIGRMDEPLARFLPGMLTGLMRSARSNVALQVIGRWLDEGRYLSDLAWYMRFAESFDEHLLRRLLDSAVKQDDVQAVRSVLLAAETQFKSDPGALIDKVFLPALRVLAAKNDFIWVRVPWFSWAESPLLLALEGKQAQVLLSALVPYPELEYDAEDIAAAIAVRWPEKVIDFLERRQAYADSEQVAGGYTDLPFDVHGLRAPLAAAEEALVEAARRWCGMWKDRFRHGGGRLLATVFPDLSEGFRDRLSGYVVGGNHEDMAFVLAILSNYEGQESIYSFVKEIVAQIDSDDPLMDDVEIALGSTGWVTGEFGMVERYSKQKAVMQTWHSDSRGQVRAFAKRYIRYLDQSIAHEQQRAEASIALRRLDYGEEADGGSNA